MAQQSRSLKKSSISSILMNLSVMVSRLVSEASNSSCSIAESNSLSRLQGALRARDFLRALDIADEIVLQQYHDPFEHFVHHQAANLVRKLPLAYPGVDPYKAAIKKFLAGEHRCKRMNQKFTAYARAPYDRRPHFQVLEEARSYIRSVIGDKPNIDRILAGSDFTAGANIDVGGNDTSQSRKLSYPRISVSPSAVGYLKEAWWRNFHFADTLLESRTLGSQQGTLPGVPTVPKAEYTCYDREVFDREFAARLKYVSYNKLFTVQKETKCDRTAGKEPEGNSLLQKGADVELKTLLKRVGLDLTQQEPNQVLAYSGSLGTDRFSFVTIDLANASNSMSTRVVKYLLPPDWFIFLDAIRSPSYELEGDVKRYEMFCSMGNGFCFPLETLIFASIVNAVQTVCNHKTPFRVYGDDIICDNSIALYVIEVLKYIGFSTNNKKTFVHGPFRESCGADWYSGINVRPFILDFVPTNRRDWIKVFNGLSSNPIYQDVLGSTRDFVYEFVKDQPHIPRDLVANASDYSYQGLLVPMDVFMGTKWAQWDRDRQTWNWTEWLEQGIASETQYSPKVLMAAALRGSRSENYEPLTMLRYTTRTRKRRYLDVCES